MKLEEARTHLRGLDSALEITGTLGDEPWVRDSLRMAIDALEIVEKLAQPDLPRDQLARLHVWAKALADGVKIT